VSRRRILGFLDWRGVWRDLPDPDAPATPHQLAKLNRLGMLGEPGLPYESDPITKAEAAGEIDWALIRVDDDAERRRS
jgi:hypothetical protein